MSRVVVLGAGPTGLGAATRLHQLGHTNWDLYEMGDTPGGLARSFVDEQGFTWDIGGHVIFSHYKYFDDVLDGTVPEWNSHVRESWVWSHGTMVPYPFQNNIGRLPREAQLRCLEGLIKAKEAKKPESGWASFGQWIDTIFGHGLAEVFLRPYNYKVWAFSPDKMSANWMGERVPVVSLEKIVRNILTNTDDLGWGPNATFRFPKHGGTGAIWNLVAKALPGNKLHYSKKVVGIHLASKEVFFEDGSCERYDWLISTLALNHFLSMVRDNTPQGMTLRKEATVPLYSSTHIVGLGFDGETPEHLRGKCWMYFPESDSPFYRATLFSHYSENNVAKPGKQWSLMYEISQSVDKPFLEDPIQATIEGSLSSKLFTQDDLKRLVSRFHIKMEQGYPTPFIGRDEWLARVQSALEEKCVLSRGRFGGWKYEVGNQDHSLMQGVEAVDRALFGVEESTYFWPDLVNTRKTTSRRWTPQAIQF